MSVFKLASISISMLVDIPALDRLVTYLQDQDIAQVEIAALTKQVENMTMLQAGHRGALQGEVDKNKEK